MSSPVKIFIAYSPKDEEHLNNLRAEFSTAERNGRVKIWDNGDISIGLEWDATIKANLHSADIILLLISRDSLASDYFYGEEMQIALQRHDDNLAKVVPVILRPCTWKETKLAKLKALPENVLPVIKWEHWDDAYLSIVEGVMKHVTEKEHKIKALLAAKEKEEAEEKARVEAEQAKREEEKKLAGKMVFVQGGSFIMGFSEDEFEDDGEEDGDDDKYYYKEDYRNEEEEEDDEHNIEFVDEVPEHKVVLNSFYIGETPVTQAQWRMVMGSAPSYFKHSDECPVESVSWKDIQVFLKKLNEKTGKIFRLPTEAEWEYAARGGFRGHGYIYSGSNNLNSVAWFCENSVMKTLPVKTKLPNELGLYDMSGNVWEWCQDRYGDYPESTQVNPQGPDAGKDRVYRGGGWNDECDYCRSFCRNFASPDYRQNNHGFRLAHSL